MRACGAGGEPSDFQQPALDNVPLKATSPSGYILPCTNCSFTKFVTFEASFIADAPVENLVFSSMQRLAAFYLADVEVHAT